MERKIEKNFHYAKQKYVSPLSRNKKLFEARSIFFRHDEIEPNTTYSGINFLKPQNVVFLRRQKVL